jgi:uncharacterized membrane protein
MAALSLVLGIVLIALGGFWVGQGLGYIQGSFMTGVSLWAWVGAGLVVLGVGLTAFSISRRLAAARARH